MTGLVIDLEWGRGAREEGRGKEEIEMRGEGREEVEKILKEIMADNFPSLMRNINLHI